jgi:hypothetical protein
MRKASKTVKASRYAFAFTLLSKLTMFFDHSKHKREARHKRLGLVAQSQRGLGSIPTGTSFSL